MPRATQDTTTPHVASCTRLSRSMEGLSRTFHSRQSVRYRGPTTPARPEPRGFGLFPGRSPLLGESLNCFLLLRVLRCFSSPGLPPLKADSRPSACWVVPFGNPRIKGHLHLPAAYRSLSRPSSPVRAKASAIRPFLLSFARTNRNLIPLSDVITILRYNVITKFRFRNFDGEVGYDRRLVYFRLYL